MHPPGLRNRVEDFSALKLRDQRPVPWAGSSGRSQIFTTLAAWKGLTRVNHVVTGARAADTDCLPLHSVSRHGLGERDTSFGEGQSPSQHRVPQG